MVAARIIGMRSGKKQQRNPVEEVFGAMLCVAPQAIKLSKPRVHTQPWFNLTISMGMRLFKPPCLAFQTRSLIFRSEKGSGNDHGLGSYGLDGKLMIG